MSNENPTALRLGVTGMLDGRTYTVVGRTVLGMDQDGETYYWNEFNLVDTAGKELTLVFEEAEDGSPWKLFRLIEPLRALSVTEARTKAAGDSALINDKTVSITLIGQSRVYFTEGRVPQGVDRGDVANYFNAEAGGKIYVTSWTGEEIEFYEGQVASARLIEDAFKLPHGPASGRALFKFGSGNDGSENYIAIAVITLLGFCGYAVYSASRDESPPEPHAKQAAPATRLPDGARAVIERHAYTVAGHALIEVATVDGKYDRHEYDLADETGGHVLLVNGLGGEAGEWHLFAPAEPPREFGPYEAAAMRRGFNGSVAGRPMQVVQLFQAHVLAVEGPSAAGVWPAQAQYGLVARQNGNWLLTLWTETKLQLFAGRLLVEAEVRKAFNLR